MAKVFKVTPKRIKRSNGLVPTPDMSVIVTTRQHMTSPFNNGSKELRYFVLSIQSVLDVGAKIGFWNAKQRQGYKYLTFFAANNLLPDFGSNAVYRCLREKKIKNGKNIEHHSVWHLMASNCKELDW